jgi:ADP-ribose pyrophosphatase
MTLLPKVIMENVLADTKFLRFNATTYSDKTGKTKTWYWAERPAKTNAVVVAAIMYWQTDVDPVRIVVTEEYRIPLQDFEWGFPAGLIDDGETVEEAASRELKEETGLTLVTELKKHSPLIYSSAGMTDEGCYIVYAQAEGKPSTVLNDDTELIKVHLMTPAEVKDLLEDPTKKIGAKSFFLLEQFARTRSIV